MGRVRNVYIHGCCTDYVQRKRSCLIPEFMKCNVQYVSAALLVPFWQMLQSRASEVDLDGHEGRLQ